MKKTLQNAIQETDGTSEEVVGALRMFATPARAESNKWFFKTGPGEYGEGDQFIGVSMPDMRRIAKQYVELLPFAEIEKLLHHSIHEYRMTGLLILTYQYQAVETQTDQQRSRTASEKEREVAELHDREVLLPDVVKVRRKQIVQFYLKHIDRVNNWDLVDCSAPQILGAYYSAHGGEQKLYTFAKSKSLWRRRVAVVATNAFIKNNQFDHTLAIAGLLLEDKEDLMHKATGWMLREVGKKDKKVLEQFLQKHATHMPRTMLRYAIERFPEGERKGWMRVVGSA